MNFRNDLLRAYDEIGGPVDNDEITDHILGGIDWDGIRLELHHRLSHYRSHLTNEGLLRKHQHPGPNTPGVHELTPAGQAAALALRGNSN